jgi:hypothetical protein
MVESKYCFLCGQLDAALADPLDAGTDDSTVRPLLNALVELSSAA